MEHLPVVNQPPCRSAAMLDYLTRQMRIGAEAALAPLGMRPRHFLALTMLRDGHEVSQQALSSILQIDGANVVGLLNELEAAGLVNRRRAPEDRRRHIVELTDQGHEQLAQAEFALAAVEDVVLAALTGKQREQLAALLHRAATSTFPA
ncbi:MAG TPA: MarR family winged helix-turn-helix transcriptional regulator [Solirubrobacteraceae bacterium]|jgi:DNA-binding MarR family transcriptional regulator|nr:MarR family winged helix-turn-helix transcriptional regulator [Solirubrobacteraceae bacterium]